MSTSDSPGTTSGASGDASGGASGTSAADVSSTGAVSDGSTGCVAGTLGCACVDGACEGDLICGEGELCEPQRVCEGDPQEPNDVEAEAFFLGDINDDDDNGSTLEGILDGPDDVDWYRYEGNDSFFNSVDPFRAIGADGAVRFCKFARCRNGVRNTELPCDGGAEPTMSPDGVPGCCHPSLVHSPDADCDDTSDDDMSILIRVDQAEDVCVGYSITYHF